MHTPFRNRVDAGRRLADKLQHYAHQPNVIVLALPRGGVPVGSEVAKALGAPLDVFVVRKLGVPWQPELAMGAVAAGGVRVLDRNLIRSAQISEADVQRVIATEERELGRRVLLYRGDRPFPELRGKTVILIDDGLATGSSMRAAVAAVRQEDPAKVVVAVPVAARETCAAFEKIADEIICLETPEPFEAVGLWYDNFSQTTDDEVRELLQEGRVNATVR